MAEHPNFKSWLDEMGCPQALASDHVIKSLHKGILGLLWEELPRTVRPSSEVSEARKNILLYKLKNEPKDPLIQDIKNTHKLREERAILDAKIKKAEEQLARQELLCRQKANLLQKKKMSREAVETKKDILKIKNDQMLLQMRDCAKMREICGHLMPPTEGKISQTKIVECLACIRSYSGGPETKMVWNKISGLLGSIKIPVLWNALLGEISHKQDELIHLDVEGSQSYNSSKCESNSDIGIAELCSEHLDSLAQCLIYEEKVRNHETIIMSYLEKIDQIIEEKRPDLSDWVPLILEVRKLESKLSRFRKELDHLENELLGNERISDDSIVQIVMKLENVDDEIATNVGKIQSALGFLKSSRALLLKTEKSLALETEKLQYIGSSEERQWLDIDLRGEMSLFQNNIDIGALRKVILKGNIGVYKHLEMCLSNVSAMIDFHSRDDIASNFPMLRVPLYYFVDLCKAFIASASLKNKIYETADNADECNETENDFSLSSTSLNSPITVVVADPYRSLQNLLRSANIKCAGTSEHNSEFDQILKSWSHQTMREVVLKILHDQTVDGSTLFEWQTKFAMLPSALHKMIERIP